MRPSPSALRLAVRVLAASGLAALSSATVARAAGGSVASRTYLSPADGALRIYDVRTPPGYDGVTKRPALLFLHGRGGSRFSWRAAAYDDALDAKGYVALYWQGRYVDLGDGTAIFSTYYVDGANGVPDETDVLACLDDALLHLAIDPERVHLAGFSQGGRGALQIGLENPDRFASLTSVAGPTDAFQGQLFSPSFPDFRAAAGGDHHGAPGAVLAAWYSQSPRFLLPNARNLPVSFHHGTADGVVPDAALFFPYRNSHHAADTPGFTDARGRTATLAELGASGGYPFEARYPAGLGHDLLAVLPAPALFAFVDGKVRVASPPAVTGVTYGGRERRRYWLRFARRGPVDGTPAGADAARDTLANALSIAPAGAVDAAVDLAAASLGTTRPLTVDVSRGAGSSLTLTGPFPAAVRVVRDRSVLAPGVDYQLGASRLELGDLGIGATGNVVTYRIEPAPAEPVVEGDLLVPALVEAEGLNGARFSTELVLGNASEEAVTLEALFLDGGGRSTALAVPARSSRAFSSGELLARLGLSAGAAPLRLRVSSGPLDAVAASARVFNAAGGGTYGLAFPVESAGASVLAAGAVAYLFGPSGARPERMNVSLFAPFEAAAGTVEVVDDVGRVLKTLPFALGARERVQLGDVTGGSTGLTGASKVVLTVGSGRVQAYGTVVSNAPTNDPYRSPALPTTRLSIRWTVPAVAAAPGRNGALFSSDVFLGVPPGVLDYTIPVDVTFRPRGGGAPRTVALNTYNGTVRVLSDVVRTHFPDLVPSAGTLEISSLLGTLAFAVTRSDGDTGPSSQDFTCTRVGSEITFAAPAAFAGLAEDAGARSNLVLANQGPATTVSLTLLAEDGARGAREVPLAPFEVRQLDSVARLFDDRPLAAGTLLVRPTAGGVVVASVARIDNVTNDPSGLAPVPFSP